MTDWTRRDLLKPSSAATSSKRYPRISNRKTRRSQSFLRLQGRCWQGLGPQPECQARVLWKNAQIEPCSTRRTNRATILSTGVLGWYYPEQSTSARHVAACLLLTGVGPFFSGAKKTNWLMTIRIIAKGRCESYETGLTFHLRRSPIPTG
jgi:hypothetical protein